MTEQQETPIVPIEHAGLWIAWNADATKIIASGEDLDAVYQAAKATGEEDPSFEKVPPSHVRLLGAIR